MGVTLSTHSYDYDQVKTAEAEAATSTAAVYDDRTVLCFSLAQRHKLEEVETARSADVVNPQTAANVDMELLGREKMGQKDTVLVLWWFSLRLTKRMNESRVNDQ